MKTIVASSICSVFFSLSSFALELQGVATKIGSDEVIYTEVHTITLNEKKLNQLIQTKYLKPDGTTFATMTSDFSKNLNIPEVQFEDYRFKKKDTMTTTYPSNTL